AVESETSGLLSPESDALLKLASSVEASAMALSSVVHVDPELTPLLNRLLGSTLVLPDLAACRAAAAALHAESKLAGSAWQLVTRDGLVLDQRGVASAGRDPAAEALASRGRQRAEAEAQLDTARADLATVQSLLGNLDVAQATAQRAAQETALNLASVEAEARAATQQVAEADRRVASRRAELEALRAQSEERMARAESERAGLARIAQETLTAEAERDQAAQAQRRARSAVSLAREQVEGAAAVLLEARSQHATASVQLRAAEDQAQRLRAEAERAAAELGRARAAVADSERSIAAERPSLSADIEELGARREEAVAESDRLRAERGQRLVSQRQAADLLSEARHVLERCRQAREQVSLAAHRSRDELQRFARELADFAADDAILELGDQPRQLRLKLDQWAPSDVAGTADHDPEWLRRRMLQLQREARAIGAVDPQAAQEFKEVSARYTFLAEQSADLERAMTELRGAMRELQDLAAERLKTTFEAVNAAFGESFVTLFGGGSASLALSDPDAPLDSGVEVIARPPGKKLQPLVALSGGERSLTMIALLMALLKVTPAPFCVLDEVDAALDDANVRRFISLLRSFSERTRFLVVTHNRASMEHADRLYGVSMDSSGVSRAVVVELPTANGDDPGTSGRAAAEITTTA
ncbi:MAG TPA: hypothetical protein VM284_02600, partial [Candidatus Limnocylindria bacterium]|nr:hypothetical protein [Candidatus Limnocylindria bacterium]